MRFTPFFLAYGAEAVLPSDLDHGAPRVKAFDHNRATEAQQDAVDLLKKAPGGFTHLLIAVDKFTKWIEAKPITNIRSEEAVKFFLDIIYRFGVPNCIIMTTEQTSPGRSS